MQLIELLEIPQLVDACARNGFYDEALDVAAHMTNLHLSRRGSKNNKRSVLNSIVTDIQRCVSDMRRSLLDRLSSEVSLPKLLTIVSTLRRTDTLLVRGISEEDLSQNQAPDFEVVLMMNFLEARSVWLARSRHNNHQSGKSNATQHFSSGPYGLCVEMIEICRNNWQTAISHFLAIFCSDSDTNSNSNSAALTLLSCWLRSHISQFVSDLRSQVEHIEDSSSVRSVMEQSLMFAQRLGIYGGDFSEALRLLFGEVLLSRVQRICSEGFNHTESLLFVREGTKEQVSD